jgi:hypothetical protein
MSIEKAAEAMWRAHGTEHGQTKEEAMLHWTRMARAALPHLLEEPTDVEHGAVLREVRELHQIHSGALWYALRVFLRLRNAPPEPPEPFEQWWQAQGASDYGKVQARIAWNAAIDFSGKPAAPPVPDPRREAMAAAFSSIPDGQWSGTRQQWAERQADIAISALDSLKGSQP